MFYCVTESKLQALAQKNTKNIIAFTMDRANRNKSVIPGDTSLTYEYPTGFFPSTDEMQEILQADNPKKAMRKFIKKKIKSLYVPDVDDVDNRNFCLAVTTVMTIAQDKNRSIMVFVKPDEIAEADKLYYKLTEMYVNAIFAEFYATTKPKDKKAFPQMIFTEFAPAWIGAKGKERKKIIKYYEKCGFALSEKNMKKKMKPKKIAKAIYRFAMKFNMSRNGAILFEMLRSTFRIDFRATNLLNSDLSEVRKDVRKALAITLVNNLCGRTKETDEKIASAVSKNKEGAKKILKKYQKRVKNVRKDQLSYYDELHTLITSENGLNSIIGTAEEIDLPELKKKTGKSEKKYKKAVKKFAKLDPAVLSAIFVHIFSRSFGNDIGDSEYNRVMSSVLKRSTNYNGSELAKAFVSIAKKANKAMKEATAQKA